jgi:hypothetical protein
MPASHKAPYALRYALTTTYSADPSVSATQRGPRRDAAFRVCREIAYSAKYLVMLSFHITPGLDLEGFELRRQINKLCGVREQRCYSSMELCDAIAGVCAGNKFNLYVLTYGIGLSTLKGHVADYHKLCGSRPHSALLLRSYRHQYISLPIRNFNTECPGTSNS